jgi:hypothetical protein
MFIASLNIYLVCMLVFFFLIFILKSFYYELLFYILIDLNLYKFYFFKKNILIFNIFYCNKLKIFKLKNQLDRLIETPSNS